MGDQINALEHLKIAEAFMQIADFQCRRCHVDFFQIGPKGISKFNRVYAGIPIQLSLCMVHDPVMRQN